MYLPRIAAFASLLCIAVSAQAITADELIAKNIEAKGGIEKLKAIGSLRTEGKLSFRGGSFEMAFSTTQRRPGAIRNEATLQGLTMVQAYDGKEAWTIQPFQGRKDPEKMSADDAKELSEEADIDGPLVDYKAKGHKIEYLGTEDVDGTDAHKLKLTRANGTIEYIYLDPDYFLEIRVVRQRFIRGTQVESEIDFGNYEQVAGVFIPFSVETGQVGASQKGQKVTVLKAEANVPVDDSSFKFPSGPAK
jgi:outer membrane lipoprotein-sorting protein